jgi:hypothetical protein
VIEPIFFKPSIILALEYIPAPATHTSIPSSAELGRYWSKADMDEAAAYFGPTRWTPTGHSEAFT